MKEGCKYKRDLHLVDSVKKNKKKQKKLKNQLLLQKLWKRKPRRKHLNRWNNASKKNLCMANIQNVLINAMLIKLTLVDVYKHLY